MNRLSAFALAGLFGLSSGLVSANDAGLCSGDVQFGYNQTEGNTNESSVLGKANAKRKSGLWTYDAKVSGQNTEAEGVRSAEQYFTSHRLAYDVDKNNYTFGYLSADKDRFSGYIYQGTFSLGYGRRLMNSDRWTWDAEIGPGLRVSEFETPSDEGDGKIEEAIVRLSTELVAKLSDSAEFSQSVSIDTGKDNTVTKSITALKTKIVGGFGLQITYTIDYNETVPNDTKHMDRQTAVTLVYNF